MEEIQYPIENYTDFLIWFAVILKEQYLTLLGWLIVKDPDAQKDWTQKETGAAEDEMVGWHHWLNGHEFKQTPGDNEGQSISLSNKYSELISFRID